ncbi:hypothetical protein L9F63_023447 [Diploptera punctata]|uniref:Ionotropic glutamate receptor C-terminal domain-containing protein n=1 Tax=Diploptera punctata TaxID=6984 RepID=A0AAD7ZJ51_DIPPU|nr:hypothetical protein L9F63_023447 [Diploptera punctata]
MRKYYMLSGLLLHTHQTTCNHNRTPEQKKPSYLKNTSYSNIQNKMLEYIHFKQSFTIIIRDDVNSLYNYIFQKFDGFIFILFGDNLINDIKRHTSIMQNISVPKARFLVIILGISPNIKAVFNFLDEFSLYETIVIHQEKEHFKLLSWSYDNCGNFKDIVFLGTCTLLKNYAKSFHIPQRPKLYNNCSFQLFGYEDPPFSINSRKHNLVTGSIIFKLLKLIVPHLNFTINFLTSKREFQRRTTVGYPYDIRKYLHPLFFSERYYTEQYTWFVPRVKPNPQWISPTHVFNFDTWVCVLLFLAIMSIYFKFFHFFQSTDFIKCFLNTYSVFLNMSVKYNSCSFRLRTVFLTWVIFSIAITTIFQAYMTTHLIDSGKQHQIDTVAELEKSDFIPIIYQGLIYIDCWRLFAANTSKFLVFYDVCSMFRYSAHNSKVAILASDETFFYTFRELGMLKQIESFHKFSTQLTSIHRTLIIDMTSPYLPLVNKIISHLVQTGIVDKLVHDSIDISRFLQRIRTTEKSFNEYVPLTVYHIFSSFIYLSVGISLSVIVFIIEIAVSRYLLISKCLYNLYKKSINKLQQLKDKKSNSDLK